MPPIRWPHLMCVQILRIEELFTNQDAFSRPGAQLPHPRHRTSGRGLMISCKPFVRHQLRLHAQEARQDGLRQSTVRIYSKPRREYLLCSASDVETIRPRLLILAHVGFQQGRIPVCFSGLFLQRQTTSRQMRRQQTQPPRPSGNVVVRTRLKNPEAMEAWWGSTPAMCHPGKEPGAGPLGS